MKPEDYVTLEVAKMLHECGFSQECNALWEIGGGRQRLSITNGIFKTEDLMCKGDEPLEILAPTLYEAQKWLREEKDVDVIPQLDHEKNNRRFFICYSVDVYFQKRFKTFSTRLGSYESALNEGIKKATELII